MNLRRLISKLLTTQKRMTDLEQILSALLTRIESLERSRDAQYNEEEMKP